MRLAIASDVRGNLTALEGVIADIRGGAQPAPLGSTVIHATGVRCRGSLACLSARERANLSIRAGARDYQRYAVEAPDPGSLDVLSVVTS